MASVISSRNGEPGQAHEGITMGPTTPNPTCPATSPSFYSISSHNSQERGQASPSQWQLGRGSLSGGCHSEEPSHTGRPAGPYICQTKLYFRALTSAQNTPLFPPSGLCLHSGSSRVFYGHLIQNGTKFSTPCQSLLLHLSTALVSTYCYRTWLYSMLV